MSPEAKCASLLEHIALLTKENRKLRGLHSIVTAGRDDVWYWQPGDEVDSLCCPVVMEAETLRKLLSK